MDNKITVTVFCPTCGLSDFNHKEDETYIQCNNCKREYLGGIDELLEYNQQQVDDGTAALGQKLLDDFGKTLESKFRNNKNFKFKR
ncbi:hypothetical protein [Sphingobacterium sp. UDSM-2020]|uniref:hypothetical protein n=1 Tax=Sphingobacterium sp. UDSM-2020 TaxID=2795738 RepID=UPI0019389705|nr:hypothetical protein [Sphingobacterium sp. UDSM-2020]QQD13739.1 hypothetical protein JAZ75_24650 [Sphingobacterium sp. UDSM-2020]